MLPDFRIRQRDYLLEIARALTQELDLDKLLGRILKIAVEMLAGQAGLIALRSSRAAGKLPFRTACRRLHQSSSSASSPKSPITKTRSALRSPRSTACSMS